MVFRTGWDLDAVCDLDIETFNELFGAVIRIEYIEKTEAAWTTMVAAQGDHKSMKKWTGQWTGLIQDEDPQKAQGAGDLNAFLDRFGGGF
jgi:hypothetical protein